MTLKAVIGLGVAASVMSVSAIAKEIDAPVKDRTDLAVAIYNADLALIKDTRKINLNTGVSDINFKEVSTLIQPETALIQGSGLAVLEQNYNYDLLSPSTLLNKYVGKEIKVISMNPATGVETTENAILLANNNGPVFKIGDRIETNFKGRYIFPTIPSNLRDVPTLTLKMSSSFSGSRDISLSYLTGGLSWKADYVAELNSKEYSFALSALVTLSNHSGVSYENANLQLIAGEVNRVAKPRAMGRTIMKNAMVDAVSFAAAPEMEEETFMDYHLYTLTEKTSIMSNQTKQVSMLSAPQIKAKKEYRFDNLFNLRQNMRAFEREKVNPSVLLTFVNSETDGLGKPLPAGTFRVYKNDSKNRLLFVGEDNIRHTAKGDEVKIKLGEAFDISAKAKMTNFQKYSSDSYQAEFEITFKNAKDEEVSINYYQNLPIGWKIMQENIASQKQNANQVLWKVPVKAEGEYVLKLQIFVAD